MPSPVTPLAQPTADQEDANSAPEDSSAAVVWPERSAAEVATMGGTPSRSEGNEPSPAGPDVAVVPVQRDGRLDDAIEVTADTPAVALPPAPGVEIGRASCRERVSYHV